MWRPHPKHASVDPSNPRAWGTCDRSGFIHQHDQLVNEWMWAGTQLINTHVLVGQRFVDEPNEQFRVIRIPPDPDPILNARPEPYGVDEGLMPMTTESAYPGDPGQVLRTGDTGEYIGVETGLAYGEPAPRPFKLDKSKLDGPDKLG
jgi:hypothetical protein